MRSLIENDTRRSTEKNEYFIRNITFYSFDCQLKNIHNIMT